MATLQFFGTIMLEILLSGWMIGSKMSLTRTALLMGAMGLAMLALRRDRQEGDPLKVGDLAPDFALPDQNGRTIRLSDFRGKKTVVLAFYIKAFTPG